MWLSTVWFCLALVLLLNGHWIAAMGVFDIGLVHKLIEIEYCRPKKPRKK